MKAVTITPAIYGRYTGPDHNAIMEWDDPETGKIMTAQGEFLIVDGQAQHEVTDDEGNVMYYVIG